MLDMRPIDDDASFVELARGLDALGGRRGNDVVKGRRLAVWTDQRIGVLGIVDDLVLVRDWSVAILGHEVLDAAVPTGRDYPFEPELEIVERFDRDDVAAAGGGRLPTRRGMLEASGLDGPPALWEFSLLETAPPLRCRAIEQQAPTCGLLSG